MTQYPVVVLAVHIEMVFQNNLILGQGAGLIRTKDVNRSKILNRIEIFYDGLLFAHGHGTLGKAGGHNHGKHLRGQANRNGDTEQERIQPISLGNTVNKEHQGDHNRHKANQNPRNRIDTFGKTGFNRFPCNCGSHGAEQRIVSDAHCHGGCAARNHIAPHKRNIRIIRCTFFAVADLGHLLHRLALTS